MRIIPAIDIINGQAVRLKQGDFEQKTVYDNNPLEVAQLFESNGLKYLHLVDLDGAKAGQVMNWEILELICKETSLRVDFAGGISSEEMVERAFELGAAQITVGSLSVREPEKVKKWIQQFGGDRIILGADLKNERIAVDGWENESSMSLDAYLEQYSEAEANYLFCTDVSLDGMLKGPALELYENILEKYPTYQLIASGGVSSAQDLDELKKIGVDAVVIGKAIYEGRITMNQLREYVS